MPQGQPLSVPDDGLTTKQRRNRPLLAVHTGDGKGKSTAAFGLGLRGWNQGWNLGVFQFVKSGRWPTGERAALQALGAEHARTGAGGPNDYSRVLARVIEQSTYRRWYLKDGGTDQINQDGSEEASFLPVCGG